jgi:hypothetical protein
MEKKYVIDLSQRIIPGEEHNLILILRTLRIPWRFPMTRTCGTRLLMSTCVPTTAPT